MVKGLERRAQKQLKGPRSFMLEPIRDSLIKNFKSIKGFCTRTCSFQAYMKKENASNLS